MPVLTHWDEDLPDVILIHYSGIWTWDEALVAASAVNELCAQRSPRRVDVIADLTAPYQPGRFTDGSDQLLAHLPPPANMRLVVLAVNRLGLTLFRHYFRNKSFSFEHTFAPGVAEAREAIQAARREAAVPLCIPRTGQLN